MKKILTGITVLAILICLTLSVRALMSTTSITDSYITAKGNHQVRVMVEPLTKLVGATACTTQAYDVFPYTECCVYYQHYSVTVTDTNRMVLVLQQSVDGSNWVRNTDTLIILKTDTSHTGWNVLAAGSPKRYRNATYGFSTLYPSVYARFIVYAQVAATDSGYIWLKHIWKE